MPSLSTNLVCTLHPDQTGTNTCANCGDHMCGRCTHDGVSGMRCPRCVRHPASGAAEAVPAAARSYRPVVTIVLILVCVGVFAYDWWALGDWVVSDGPREIWRIPEGGLGELALYRPQLAEEGEWYRVITSGFIHFNLVHLVINMLALWALGAVIERALGAVTLATIFMAGIIGGSLGAVIVESDVQVGGASGAVFGLLGAIAMLQLVAGRNILAVVGVILINVGLSFLPYVALGGHIGGLAVGAAAGLIVGLCRHVGPRSLALAPMLVAGMSVVVFALLVWVVAPEQTLWSL